MNYRRSLRVSCSLENRLTVDVSRVVLEPVAFRAQLQYWDGILAQMRYRNEQHHARLRRRDEARYAPGRP